jgi:hypothetical protein
LSKRKRANLVRAARPAGPRSPFPASAGITGQKADRKLGLRYFRNGALVSTIVLDTSQVATDSIDYVATDPDRTHLDQHPHRIIELAAPR